MVVLEQHQQQRVARLELAASRSQQLPRIKRHQADRRAGQGYLLHHQSIKDALARLMRRFRRGGTVGSIRCFCIESSTHTACRIPVTARASYYSFLRGNVEM